MRSGMLVMVMVMVMTVMMMVMVSLVKRWWEKLVKGNIALTQPCLLASH